MQEFGLQCMVCFDLSHAWQTWLKLSEVNKAETGLQDMMKNPKRSHLFTLYQAKVKLN